MIIRLAQEEDDIRACVALDHDYVTERVWQMDFQEQSNGASVTFHRARLPRAMRGRYPRALDQLMARWEQGESVLVANDGSEIVGYLHLVVQEDEGTAWARNLAVAPRLRRRGIGTALLQSAADWLRQQSVSRLLLEMTTKNYPAICFAQKLGFSFCGYNDRYYANRDIALFFAKNLR
jgi:ribosomal protein S18 acetylase RimI-like enzyme